MVLDSPIWYATWTVSPVVSLTCLWIFRNSCQRVANWRATSFSTPQRWKIAGSGWSKRACQWPLLSSLSFLLYSKRLSDTRRTTTYSEALYPSYSFCPPEGTKTILVPPRDGAQIFLSPWRDKNSLGGVSHAASILRLSSRFKDQHYSI